MEVFIAIIAGLAFRLLLSNLDEPLAVLSPALLGICEGTLVHYLPTRNSSLDHYLAFGLRIVVDLLFTENTSRMMLVLFWTALVVLASDALSPAPHRERKRSRRHTARTVILPPLPQQLSTPLIPRPLNPPLTFTPVLQPPQMAPSHPPERPPSPPSFFLDGDSEINAISPTSEQRLEYNLEPDLRSQLSSPTPNLLLTPPVTLTTDAQQSDTLSPRRLSTIHELSGDESGNLDRPDIWPSEDHARLPGAHIVFDKANTSYPPSIATSDPLPVPNATYFHSNWARTTVLENGDPDPLDSLPILPVPNAAIRLQQSEWKIDPASESDELRTPGARHFDLTDHDELRTPAALKKELSPLFSDQPLPAGFSGTREVQSNADHVTPTVIPIVDPTLNTSSASSTVECFPQVVKDHVPDLDVLSEAETLKTETDASVISPGSPNRIFSRAESYRQEAWKNEQDRRLLNDRLREAENEARIRDALFIREEIRVLDERSTRLHEKAARRFIKARNPVHKPQTVDVHGLRTFEAVRLTEKALRNALTNGYPDIKVIVGKGLHSRNKIPVLKGAIMRAMEQYKIPCRVDRSNTGILIISLPPL